MTILYCSTCGEIHLHQPIISGGWAVLRCNFCHAEKEILEQAA